MRGDAARLLVEYYSGPDAIVWSPSGDDLHDLVARLPREAWHRSRTRSGGFIVTVAEALVLLELAGAEGWSTSYMERRRREAS